MTIEVVLISTLHTSTGSFTMQKFSDGTGVAEIFDQTVHLKCTGNKIDISSKLDAKAFKRGAKERDEIVSWLKQQMIKS